MMLLKLAAAPAVVWLASQAGRRWGHRVAGLIGGFPLIAGPIVLFIALDAGAAFGTDLAWAAMSVAPATAVHCFVYAWLARAGLRWPWCLVIAWGACVGTAWFLTGMAWRGLPGFAFALGLALLLARALPAARGAARLTPVPDMEILVRMAAALALAAVVMLGAQSLGTRLSGVLLGFPITASVLPVFTLALQGPEAAIRLLAGFAMGLVGFTTFFFTFASLMPAAGPLPAFAAGALASVAAVSLPVLWNRRRGGHGA